MKEFWKSTPAWMKALIVVICGLVIFSALGPSIKDRKIATFTRASTQTFDDLIAAGAIQTYKSNTQDPHLQVVLVWNANTKGKFKSYFFESDFTGADLWEFPVNAEKHLPAIDAIHQMTANPMKVITGSGSYRQVGNPFGYTIPKAKLPNAAQRKVAKKRGKELTKAFAKLGLTVPGNAIAYVKIPNVDRIFLVNDMHEMFALKELYGLPYP